MNAQSVATAARALGVSQRRVRQLLAAGDLPGARVGRDWIVDRDELDRWRSRRRHVGRPWKPASAWAVLALANGEEPALSPVERSRARGRLAEHGLVGLAGRLSARSDARRYYGHPAALEPLTLEPGVVRGGVSAAAEYGAGVIGGELVEVYVAASRVAALVEKYALDGSAERPNLLLRVVGDAVWPFAAGVHVAPRPIVAVDLMDADDERARRAGRRLATGVA
jgi:excisionase family DNA binding protein